MGSGHGSAWLRMKDAEPYVQALGLNTDVQIQISGIIARTRVKQRFRIQRNIDTDTLILVTCYPLDRFRPGGPLRYLVEARPVPGERKIQSPGLVMLSG